MNESEKRKRIKELRRRRAALKGPPAPEEDMIPIDVDERRNLVLARRYVGATIELHVRKAEGDWKPVFDYLLARKRINDEIESILGTMPEYADVKVVPAEDIDEDDETTE